MPYAPSALLLVLLASTLADARMPLRREQRVEFALDPKFQRNGGVQYFYELVRKEELPHLRSSAFQKLLPLDVKERYGRRVEPLHVLMGRVCYQVRKDIAFFSAARANDVGFMNAVVPEAGIRRSPDGSFLASRTPSNRFTVRHLDAAEVRARAGSKPVSRLVELAPEAGLPGAVVIQENTDFARVMGFRTGEASITWTAHYPLEAGSTRICVYSLSYLHNIPPGFMGGEQRVLREAVVATRELIENVRAFDEEVPGDSSFSPSATTTFPHPE